MDLRLPCSWCGWGVTFPAARNISGWMCPQCVAGYTNLEVKPQHPHKKNMPSENARAVAQEVIATVRKGEKVNKQKIQCRHGYPATSTRSMKAFETKTYQEEIQPIVEAMTKERTAALDEAKRKRGKANPRSDSPSILLPKLGSCHCTFTSPLESQDVL